MSIYLIWFLIGISFLIFEIMSPAFILFFFGLGAWITSLAVAIFPNLSFNQQIIIFSSSALTLLLLLRNYVRNVFLGNQNSGEDQYSKEISSEESLAVVTKTVPQNGFGEIKFRGTFYKAKSENIDIEIVQGENIKVVRQGDEQGSFYIIQKLN